MASYLALAKYTKTWIRYGLIDEGAYPWVQIMKALFFFVCRGASIELCLKTIFSLEAIRPCNHDH